MCHSVIDTFYRRSFCRFIAISIFRMVLSPAKRGAISVSDDLIEATKTFRGYKSPRNDKIGAARRTERHAACRARTHARGILMASPLHEEPLHTRRHSIVVSGAVHFVFSKRKSDTGADIYKGFSVLDHYCLRDLPKKSHLIFYHFRIHDITDNVYKFKLSLCF